MVILPEDFDFDSIEARKLSRLRRNKKNNKLDIWPYVVNRHNEKIERLLNDWTTDIYNNNIRKGIIYVEITK